MKIKSASLLGMLVLSAIGSVSTIATLAWAESIDDHHASHLHMMESLSLDAKPSHMMKDETKHSLANYTPPLVKLVRDDGKNVLLAEELNDGRPVIMNFVFTSCTTVCPVASRTFSVFQEGLGSERDKVHMVSISTDPEQDSPSVLKEYASKYGAGPEWHFYTGSAAASIATQQAFDVYRGDKMDQPPVTLLRAVPGQPWLRIEGFVTADELLRDYRKLIASK